MERGDETMKTLYAENGIAYLLEAEGTEAAHIIDLMKAEAQGRVIDKKTALAMAAGARAIENNKRLQGITYVYDVFGENGEPKEISYGAAAKLLRVISTEVMTHETD